MAVEDEATRAEYMRSRPRFVCVDSRLSALVHMRDGFSNACHALTNVTDFTVLAEVTDIYELLSSLSPAVVRDALCATAIVTAAEVISILQIDSSLGENVASWLKRAIEAMSNEQLQDLLYFVTAARCMPSSHRSGGTGSRLRFTHARSMTNDHLPVSHTCFNSVDTPRYESFESLQAKLLQAMAIGRQQGGFQFA